MLTINNNELGVLYTFFTGPKFVSNFPQKVTDYCKTYAREIVEFDDNLNGYSDSLSRCPPFPLKSLMTKGVNVELQL